MMELTRDDDRFFSTHAVMASFTDWSSMPSLSSMLGGQRRVRHKILDEGHMKRKSVVKQSPEKCSEKEDATEQK
jgi:hypothetical protein